MDFVQRMGDWFPHLGVLLGIKPDSMIASLPFLLSMFTPFYVLGILAIVVGIPLAYQASTVPSHAAIMGFFVAIGVFVCLVCLVIDRILVLYIPQYYLVLVEIGTLILAWMIYGIAKERKYLIDVRRNTLGYVFLFKNDGRLVNTPTRYSFPFSRKWVPNGNSVVYDPAKIRWEQIDLSFPARKSYSTTPISRPEISGTLIILDRKKTRQSPVGAQLLVEFERVKK